MRAKTFAEHGFRARAAVQYPGWRVDFVEIGRAHV